MFPRKFLKRIQRFLFFFLGLVSGQLFVGAMWPVRPNLQQNRTASSMLVNDDDKSSSSLHKLVLPWNRISEAPSLPKVFVVTPTYRRPNQMAELTRIAQALYPSRHFLEWFVIDEAEKSSATHLKMLQEFILEFNISGRVLHSIKRSEEDSILKSLINSVLTKPRVQRGAKGVSARRTGLKLIREMKAEGVVYFADDDNTYDSDIFRQMQGTQRVSMWPVGCLTQLVFSTPILKYGQIDGFYDGFQAGRKFPVDFAEFAINNRILHENPRGNIPYQTSYEETRLLVSLGVIKEDVEPLANQCTEVMAWHTKTRPSLSRTNKTTKTNLKSNIGKLFATYQFL